MVVCEWEREGFVMAMFNELEEAKKLEQEIIDQTHVLNAEQFLDYLELRVPVRYHLKGNAYSPLFGVSGSCNGFMTTVVVKIDTREFCLRTFVKTRENYRLAIDFDEDDESPDSLEAKFPWRPDFAS
jgi:hypothetical protein